MPRVYDRARVRLDRYIFSELLRPSLLGALFYGFVLLMNQFFLLAREGLQRSWSLLLVSEMLLLALPKIVVLAGPMAMLLGVLVGMGRLSADSEIVALRASGASYYRISRPVLALGLLGFLFTAAAYNLGVPWAHGRALELRREMFRTADPNREIRPGVFFEEIPQTLIYAQRVDRQDESWPLRNVFIATERALLPALEAGEAGAGGSGDAPPRIGDEGERAVSGAERETLLCGQRARIEITEGADEARFVVDQGEIHVDDPASPASYRRIRFEKPFTTVVPLLASEPSFAPRKASTQEMTLAQLWGEIAEVRAIDGWEELPAKRQRMRRALIELHWRFALPFAALAFCLIAFPLGLVSHRGGKGSGFALSLVVIVLYWVALTVARDLALEGRLSAALGAWGPNLVVCGMGLALVSLQHRRDLFSLSAGARPRLRSWQSRLSSGFRSLRGSMSRPANLSLFRAAPTVRAPIPLVDIYIGRRFLTAFGIVLLSAATLYAVVEIRSLIDSLLQTELPLSLAMTYLAYLSPGMTKVLMPVASSVAALITLGSLCRFNEDTALKAAGVSIFRISAPILVLTGALCAGYFILQDYIAPSTNREAARVRDEIEGRVGSATVGGTRWIFGKRMRLYSYGDYDSERMAILGVSVTDLKEDPFRIRRRLRADQVRWKADGWVAEEGWQREFKADEERYATLRDSPLSWPESPDDFARQERSLVRSGRLAEELNYVALRRHVERMKNSGYDTTRLRVSLHEKLAFPAAPLVMVLVSLPFGLRTGRRGALYGVGIAMLLVIAYWACFAVSSALGHEAVLPPVLAAWAPNLLFGLTGTFLLLSSRS